MSAHTPVPWRLAETVRPGVWIGKRIVFTGFLNDEPGRSNARLIAAAPDLLAALQNLENDDGSIPDHAWALVQAAIAKATQPPATKDTP
jgi:hypothetical protein